MKRGWIIIALWAYLGTGTLWAAAPKIQSLGLRPLSSAKDKVLRALFIIEGDQEIVALTLNGKPVPFDKGKRVVIGGAFILVQGNNRILITAKDRSGAQSVQSYDVAYYPLLGETKSFWPSLRVKDYTTNLALLYDSNPGLDQLGDGVTLNSRQADQLLEASAQANWDGLWGFGGALGLQLDYYSKYHPDLASEQVFLQAEQGFELADGAAWLFAYEFRKQNRGGYDFLMRNSFATGMRYLSLNRYGSKRILMLIAQVDLIDFASPLRTDGRDLSLRWDLKEVERGRVYSYREQYALGTRTEGIFRGDHQYLSADWSWREKMLPSWSLGLNVGLEYRQYQDNPSTGSAPRHIETPMELTLKSYHDLPQGYKLTGQVTYVENRSNWAVYQRQVVGISLDKDF